jgi:hypothetical protein
MSNWNRISRGVESRLSDSNIIRPEHLPPEVRIGGFIEAV